MSEPRDNTPAIRLTPITLRELFEELHWPRLLRVPGFALRPARIGLGLVALLVIALLDQIPSIFDGQAGPLSNLATRIADQLGQLGTAAGGLDLDRVIQGGRAIIIDAPAETFAIDPIAAVLLFPLMLVVWGVAGGAISRSVACEFSQRVHISWPQALGFALSHWLSLAMSFILPIAFMLSLVLLITLGAFALLSLPYLNILGAVLFPVLLVLAFVGVVTFLGIAVGHSMLAPAIACEATDAIDATQRVYHYVLHRLVHLLTHLVILGVLATILFTLGSIVVGAMDDLVTGAIQRLAPESAIRLLDDTEALTGPDAIAARLIATWRSVPALLLSALAVSYIHTAGTVLYLLIREINDHQATEEIWMPTMIEATQAASDPDASR